MNVRVLFVLGNVYPHDDANSIIIKRICKELQTLSHDIDIFVLGTGEDERCDIIDGIKLFRFSIQGLNDVSKELDDFLQSNISISRLEKIKRLCQKPILFIQYVHARMRTHSPSIQYRNKIQGLHRQYDFDAIIGVSFPFFACLGVAQANLKIPFLYYQLDPYSSHYLQPNKRLSMRQENFVCRRARKIVMTDLIYKDYLKTSLKKYLSKTIILGFPAIENNRSTDTYSLSCVKDDHQLRMLYLGSLYYDIRSPNKCLEFLYEMKKQGYAAKIDFVGPVIGCPDNETRLYLDSLGNTVRFHGRVSEKKSRDWINNANVLINIGNSIENQMPSKIFEYFSTGKQILNFHKLENCPTLKYTMQYPLCMNISGSQQMTQEFVAQMYNFCVEHINDVVPYDKVETIYRQFTSTEVGKEIYKLLKSIV